jgi:WD40 repeat protein
MAAAVHADEPAPLGVRVVAFSPDGKLLAAGTGEPNEAGAVTCWDLTSRKVRWSHSEKTGIPGLAFSPDGKTLAIAVYDNAARLLDVAGGNVQVTLLHPKEARGVAFSPDGKLLATACWDKSVRLWDLAAGTETLKCVGHTDRIFSVAFSPDGEKLLSAGGGDGAKLWDAGTGMELRSFKHGSFYVPCATFTPDGHWVIAGGYDGTARLFNVESGEVRAKLGGLGGINSLAYSQAAGRLAVCGFARTIGLYDLNLDEPSMQELEGLQSLIARLDDNSYDVREATGKELLKTGFRAEAVLRTATKESSSAEVRIRARRLRQEMLSTPLITLRGSTGNVEALAFSADGKLLASGGKDGMVRLWNISESKQVFQLVPSR